ncbi:hypothetical protein ATCR1_19606 [Agrobacterium tumefaciens CCNWGS0286]|nr:hypothetical protein ATCR1_19606 [Agrobacterium tumefaciens CCNWGS0286]
MTTIAISIDYHSRRATLTAEHMIDSKTEKRWVLIGN